MSTVGLRKLRIWIVVLSVLMVLSMAVCYILLDISWGNAGQSLELIWMDWATITLSVAIFFSYIYSLKGKPFLHKFLRAFLMLFLSVFLLYINVQGIVYEIQRAQDFLGYQAFGCESRYNYCVPCWVYDFLCVFTGLFVVLDLIWTLKVGPLERGHHYGRHGYGEQANIVVVSPDQPQGVQLQGGYPIAPGQKIEDQGYIIPITQTTQPFVYPQQPYLYQQQQQQQQPVTPQPYYQQQQQPVSPQGYYQQQPYTVSPEIQQQHQQQSPQ